MKYDFIKPKIEPKHFILGQGNVPFNIINPERDWSNDLPKDEIQQIKGLETYNCTAFNTLKQIQMYEKFAFHQDNNYSERWLGIIAGTEPPGNDPHIVYEAIRKYGLIPDSMLPFSDDITTIEDYYSFKGGNKDACYEAGIKWLETKNFFHEWVFDPNVNLSTEQKKDALKTALYSSPICLAVYAWIQNDKGIYIKLGEENHWTCMSKFDEYQNIIDSYNPTHKLADQDIIYAKRIYIQIKSATKIKDNKILGNSLCEFIRNILNKIITKK